MKLHLYVFTGRGFLNIIEYLKEDLLGTLQEYKIQNRLIMRYDFKEQESKSADKLFIDIWIIQFLKEYLDISGGFGVSGNFINGKINRLTKKW